MIKRVRLDDFVQAVIESIFTKQLAQFVAILLRDIIHDLRYHQAYPL